MSPLRTGGGEVFPFKDARRAVAPFNEAETRGDAAERAVAPRVIDGAGCAFDDTVGDVLRVVCAVRGGCDAVVAIRAKMKIFVSRDDVSQENV